MEPLVAALVVVAILAIAYYAYKKIGIPGLGTAPGAHGKPKTPRPESATHPTEAEVAARVAALGLDKTMAGDADPAAVRETMATAMGAVVADRAGRAGGAETKTFAAAATDLVGGMMEVQAMTRGAAPTPEMFSKAAALMQGMKDISAKGDAALRAITGAPDRAGAVAVATADTRLLFSVRIISSFLDSMDAAMAGMGGPDKPDSAGISTDKPDAVGISNGAAKETMCVGRGDDAYCGC